MLKKDIDVGGTSDAWDIPYLVEIFKTLNPRTVLDVGTGCFGKNAYILRQYVEHKFRHLYSSSWLEIYGIEAYEKNAAHVKGLNLYDEVVIMEALEVFSKFENKKVFEKRKENGYEYLDVIVCTHVLEHHTKEDAWKLLREMYKWCKKAIVLASPYGEYVFEGNPNPYQDHKSTWTPDEIATKYPITTPIMGRNNTGHEEFLIVIPK